MEFSYFYSVNEVCIMKLHQSDKVLYRDCASVPMFETLLLSILSYKLHIRLIFEDANFGLFIREV